MSNLSSYHKTTKKSSSLSLSLSDDLKPKKLHGFTIVELLIVIVVIGILAAISIAAYAGISQSARDSSAKASAKQLATKLETTYVQDGTYPSALSDIGIRNTDTTSYQYTSSPTTNPPSWCSTVTVGSTSYYVSNTTATPTKGGCPGHGQGGVEAITNLVRNPNATSSGVFGAAGAVGSQTVVTDASSAYSGSTFLRRTFTASGNGGLYYGTASSSIDIEVGKTYTASAYVRASKSVTISLTIEWKSSPSTSIIARAYGPAAVVNNSSWTRVSMTDVAPEGAGVAFITLYVTAANSWSAGDYEDVDGVMVTEGSTLYNFADGSSDNWVWNGTPNASTSTGPAL